MKIDVMTPQEHREAIIRRKIKFAVKYPAIIWMFPKGTTDRLIEELVQRVPTRGPSEPAHEGRLRAMA